MQITRIFMYFLFCYVLGSLNSAYLLTKIFYGKDIREFGDGNAGTTNVFENINKILGIIVFLFDFLKGVLVIYIGKIYFSEENIIAIGFAFLVLGHDFPFFFNLKGGTGIASMFGGLFAINHSYAVIVFTFYLLAIITLKLFKVQFLNFNYHEEGEIFGFLLAIFLALFSKDVLLKKWLVASLLVVVFKHREKVFSILHLKKTY